MGWCVSVIYLLGVTILTSYVQAATLFSTEQLTAIQNLREIMKPELSSDFMKEDFYLAKWLAEKDFNVEEARRALQENIAWRRNEKIDSILGEQWEDMNSRFPYSRNTQDKSGRPVLFFDIGKWDIANYFSQRDSSPERFTRYFVKMMEESEAHIRQLRSEGRDVSQLSVVVNMGGWSNEKHACFQCLKTYPTVAQTLTAHFPHAAAKSVLVNTPLIFRAAFFVLGEKNQDCFQMFGQDQKQWEPMLLQFVDPNQVPGGLLEDQVLAVKDNSEGLLQFTNELKKDTGVVTKVVGSEALLEARSKSKEEYSPPVPVMKWKRPSVYRRKYSKMGYRKRYHVRRARKRYNNKRVFRKGEYLKNRKMKTYRKKECKYPGCKGGYSEKKKNYPIVKNSWYQWPGKYAPVIYPLSYL